VDKKELTVAIIGAGIAGLYMAERLRRAGIPYTIFEKAGEVGGTWHVNNYPGLHVDVLTRSYEFPFARYRGWSRRYAAGSEIQDYLIRVSRDRGIVNNIRFNCEIIAARFDGCEWNLEARDGSKFTAKVMVAATGFLRVPRIPQIEGRESFAGPAFHSARWDHEVDMSGKRIGVIGTGSSGVQILTELGARGHDVTHFVRTPQWMMIRENPKVSWFERLILSLPGTARFLDGHLRRMRDKIEGPPTWRFEPGPLRDRVRQQYADDLQRALPDPEMLRKLMPTEPAGCKRIAKTERYYSVVQQPNVEVVVGPISRIEPGGVVDADGRLHELDILVFATGFDTHAYMRPMQVEVEGGGSIEELWADSVYSYYGVAVPRIPNFFLLNGPFAPINLVPIPALVEDESGLIMQLLDLIRTRDVALSPTGEATRRFVEEVKAAVPNTTFGECDNWFTDKSGTPILWPWTKAEHTRRLETARLEDFEMVPLEPTRSDGRPGRVEPAEAA
jgi:cation diffusion facilitator CzcD-associated flavoprotein CzcO